MHSDPRIRRYFVFFISQNLVGPPLDPPLICIKCVCVCVCVCVCYAHIKSVLITPNIYLFNDAAVKTLKIQLYRLTVGDHFRLVTHQSDVYITYH